ncbi:MAG: hypothetical protein OXC26_01365 [Albidovulum sp.]|nr:hypothetical protein [Albidovulum sp.]
MGLEANCQGSDFRIAEEALPALPSVAADAEAGVGPLLPETHSLRLAHDDRKDRHGPVRATGVARNEANQCTTSCRVISAIWHPEKRGSTCLRRYPRFTSIVRGFQIRSCLRNAASETASKTVSSGCVGTGVSCLIAASIGVAREHASLTLRSSASPTIFQMRLPLCWQWMK